VLLEFVANADYEVMAGVVQSLPFVHLIVCLYVHACLSVSMVNE